MTQKQLNRIQSLHVSLYKMFLLGALLLLRQGNQFKNLHMAHKII